MMPLGDLSQQPSSIIKYDDLYLVSLPTAVTCARMFAHVTLDAWNLRPLIPEAEQLAARLVSDVLSSATELERLVLRLRLTSEKVAIEVWDATQNAPAGSPPDGYNAGFFPLDKGGKVVWVEVPRPSA